ncbi:hypothetical protein SLS62_007544 [Diatrype stigma]|uniref:Helicase C-terminal domain-containing protein n=1 Tax=Diatrype stigma TaxID=117547 RepID=A0AAN9UN40_9PEZI
MTGTVIQNSLEDLASLTVFLRVPILDETTNFRRRSTSAVLSTLGVKFEERRLPLAEAERRAYDSLATSCGQSIKAAVNRHPGNGGSTSILTAVLRLRIFCNTGLSSPIDDTSNDVNKRFWPDEVASLLQQSGEDICADCSPGILVSNAEDELPKSHKCSQHRQKYENYTQLAVGMGNTEPILDEEMSITGRTESDTMQDVQYQVERNPAPTTVPIQHETCPSKLKALLADIKEHYLQDKSIIFSFWARSLDLVSDLFRKEDISFGRVDGRVPPSQRKQILAEFHNDSSVRVLLMTIGTGAVGLNNLSVASRVHILEPQWNPYTEEQAIGRVFRLGQKKEVRVIRYIMKTTVEGSIEHRQLRKMQYALKGGLRSSDQEVSESRRRIMHLQALGKIIEATVLTRDDGLLKG